MFVSVFTRRKPLLCAFWRRDFEIFEFEVVDDFEIGIDDFDDDWRDDDEVVVERRQPGGAPTMTPFPLRRI